MHTRGRAGWAFSWALAAAVLLLGLVGCGGTAAREHRAAMAELTYPEAAPRGESLPVHVVRAGSQIRLANTSARPYEDMQLWLNRRFVLTVETLPIGADNRFQLKRFINRHGERYPRAGWLTPRQTEPVVLAELYDPEAKVRHRLTVQPDASEDE
jgi:hypothetical protein